MIDPEISLYAQNLKVKWNVITDSFSQYHHLYVNQITCLLNSVLPNQIPKKLIISLLMQEITFWLKYILKRHPEKILEHSTLMPILTGSWIDGSFFSIGFNLKITLYLKISKRETYLHLSELS